MNPKTVLIHEDFRRALNVSSLKTEELIPVASNTISHFDLEELGFGNSITAQKAKTTKSIVDNVIRHNEIIGKLKEIEARYPQYRIISLSKIIKLMEKYNLYLGYSGNYIQEIPFKNVQELKEYEQEVIKHYLFDHTGFLGMTKEKYYNNGKYLIVAPKQFFREGLINVSRCLLEIERAELHYSIPPSMSNMFDTDPIVLRPLNVMAGEIFFHIVTAWDLESTDEEVTKDVPKQIENN